MIAALVLIVIIAAGLVALRLREMARERDVLAGELRALEERLQDFEEVLRRQAEDVVVATHVLLDRGIVDEEDLEDVRYRYVDMFTNPEVISADCPKLSAERE